MRFLALLGAMLMVFAAAPLLGQQGSGGLSPTWVPEADTRPAPAWGTTAFSTYVINAMDLDPLYADTVVGYSGALSRTIQSGSPFWGAAVYLPAGAIVTFIEIQGCDKGAGSIEASLWSGGVTGTAATETLHGSVTTIGDTQCTYWADSLINPPTIDNFNRSYMVQVIPSIPGSTLSIQAIRLYYKLQASPAPGFATFSDVPMGSALHQYVEALVGAGITAGCGDGNFCPNQAVTRGQMAVFLTKALGLHWPN